jgi:hypothetical protein
VLVSDGSTVDRLSAGQGTQRTVGLADMVSQLNRLHSNDKIYVTLLNKTTQVVLDGEALPGLPLSMANVLAPLKDTQRVHLSGESLVEAASFGTGYVVSGSQVVNLLIR